MTRPGPKPGVKHDWPALLASAKARDLHISELAHELNLSEAAVRYQEERCGLRLRRFTRGKQIDWHAELLRACIEGEGANEFCLSRNIAFATLQAAERRHGIRLPRHVPRDLEITA